MKKIVLIVAFVFATGSIINANSSDDAFIKINSNKTIGSIEEDFGCARDCVDQALETVAPIRDEARESDSMYIYMHVYTSCYHREC